MKQLKQLKQLKVLIACEESQTVCKAFRALGHEAYSCDLQECSGGHPEWHFQQSVFELIDLMKWDLLIGHPPCTYLSYAGTAHWNRPGRLEKRLEALSFFAALWNSSIKHICLENPKGCASPTIAKYSQEVQPYYFGDIDQKTTWLWLKNLPCLKWQKEDDMFSAKTSLGKPEPVFIDSNGKARYFTDAVKGHGGGKEGRQRARSKTFPGIADAMAKQWSEYIINPNQ